MIPISGRSDGNGRSSGRSVCQPVGGTAQISECVAALTSRTTPPAASLAGRQIVERLLRDHQVRLGVADQVLHHALRLRIRAVAEIGPEPVVGGEADIVRRSAPPRWRPPRPSGSPSGPPAPPAGTPPSTSKHSANSAKRRGRALVVGEPDEPEPRPGQHRAEHVQPGLDTPVDDQRLTRRPHPRPAAPMMITPPRRLRLRDQPAEVPRPTPHSRPPGPPAAAASPRSCPCVLATRSATSSATSS